MSRYLLIALSLLMLSGCDFKKVDEGKSSLESGMKCGAGKCGANMFDGNSALSKKKSNILSQMREDDTRKECVKNAKTTKEAYDCVREPGGKKLTTKCGGGMKCGAGKCGDAMQKKEKASTMKCGAGKCGASMQGAKPEPKKEPAMKCGAGKCGSGM